MPANELFGYWISQFLGGILASIILLIGTSKRQVALTATKPSSNGTAILFEIVMTAIFVLVILQASRSDRFGPSALIAIPLTLLAVHLAAIPFSGASVNPARSFGPDLVGNTWTGIWIYLIAPPIGAALGWAIHAGVVTGTLGPAPAGVAEVLEESSTAQ
jgi:aquaporin Z